MTSLSRPSIILACAILLLAPSQALSRHIPGGPFTPEPNGLPGPCGLGRVQRTICETRQHKPAPPEKICRKVCLPAPR